MRKIAIFILILFFDFSSKYLVEQHLPLMQFYSGFPFGGIGLVDSKLLKISIVHTTNTGTAWGLFANYQHILLLFRIMIITGIFGYLLFLKPAKILQMPLTIIAAGALGNIIDFFVYGHVIDMFFFIFYKYAYPIFNIADSVIFCSVIYLLFYSNKTKFRKHASSS